MSARALVRIAVALLIALVLGRAYAIVAGNQPAAGRDSAAVGFSH